jgi:hypothetical protein
MKHQHEFDARGELRDIFAAVAMIGLMNDKTATPKWVANQAYRYADMMLEVRDEVSHNTTNKETLINE